MGKLRLLCITIIFLFFIILSGGCVQYYEAPSQPGQQPAQPPSQPYGSPSENSVPTYQQSTEACPPSLINCQIIRGAANQLTIQCPDGRQYIRGAAGQITIQYPGKQIIVGSAGQETIQHFDYSEAQCLIQWFSNL